MIRREPTFAPARHALGLSLLRQQRWNEALAALHKATRLAPDNPTYANAHAALAAFCRQRPGGQCQG